MLTLKALRNLPAEALHHALTPLVDLAWDYHSLLSGAVGRILDIIIPLLAPPNHESTIQWSSYPPAEGDYDDWTQYANLAQEVVLAIAYFFPAECEAWNGGRMVEELLGMMIGRKVAQFAWEGEEQTDWIKEDSVSCIESYSVLRMAHEAGRGRRMAGARTGRHHLSADVLAR